MDERVLLVPIYLFLLKPGWLRTHLLMRRVTARLFEVLLQRMPLTKMDINMVRVASIIRRLA